MAGAGRNDLCSCGSGKNFKRCHGLRSERDKRSYTVVAAVIGAVLLAALAAGIVSYSSGSSGVRVWDPVHGHFHNENGVQVP